MRGKVKENPFRKDKCCGGTRKTTLVAPLYQRQVITRRKYSHSELKVIDLSTKDFFFFIDKRNFALI